MRIFSFISIALLSATTLFAQEARTSVAVAPPDVKAPPPDAQKTASGLATKVITAGKGTTHPGPTAVVTVHYTGWKTTGEMFDSSVLKGKPLTFALNRVIAGWGEGVQLMVQGEKRRMWIPESLAYKGVREPRGMLVFDVELISFENIDAPADVSAPPSDAKRTPSGLAYKVLKAGTGARHPSETSTVTVHYTGWQTNGKRFDSSIERGQPATFPLDGVIKGWTEGVQLMVEGEKVRFWIPESLAYKGQQGQPAGMLVFDVELLSIK